MITGQKIPGGGGTKNRMFRTFGMPLLIAVVASPVDLGFGKILMC